MSYDAVERSAAGGRPVEIYAFARGSITWRYTSADRDVVVESRTHKAAPIKRGSLEQGPELNRSGLKLTVPRDLDVVQQYQLAPPSEPVVLILRQYHEGDGEPVLVWSGRIVSVSFKATQAEINLEPVATSMRRTGLRRRYQGPCPHVLYGPGCALAAPDWAVSGTVTAVANLQVTAAVFATQPDGWWEGGYIQWLVATGTYERRFIFAHTGDTIEVDALPFDLPVGTVLDAFPGCDHTLATCDEKFDNAPNYGGMPFIPRKNPFGSDPLY